MKSLISAYRFLYLTAADWLQNETTLIIYISPQSLRNLIRFAFTLEKPSEVVFFSQSADFPQTPHFPACNFQTRESCINTCPLYWLLILYSCLHHTWLQEKRAHPQWWSWRRMSCTFTVIAAACSRTPRLALLSPLSGPMINICGPSVGLTCQEWSSWEKNAVYIIMP